MSTHPDEWPAPRAPLLAAVAEAFLRRRKAIAYHSPIDIDLEIDPEPPRRGCLQSERLNVDSAGLRLSVWADGSMWLRAGAPAGKKGWRYLVTLRGDVTDSGPREVVEWFERSSLAGYAREGAKEYLLELWSDVTPVIEESRP